ncbi:MAG: hypothetical protein Kow00107_00190 [Planctomycetota bacterium]
MMRKALFVSLLFTAVLMLPGCEKEPEKKDDLGLNPSLSPEILIFDSDKKQPEKTTAEDVQTPAVVIHPDLRGKPKLDEAIAMVPGAEDDAELEIKTLSRYVTGNTLKATLAIINNGKGGKNVNLFIFFYDSTGTLTNTELHSRYIAPSESWIFVKNFSANSRDVRWVFRAVRRK